MGQQQQTPTQDQQQQTTSRHGLDTADEAYDRIQSFVTLQHTFRQTGIDQACNQILQTDPPSLGETLLKSGLKLALAAGAGAVGAFTGGLGWVALGAIGLGFGVGGEIVDAVFSGGGAPQGLEEFRTNRKNVLARMRNAQEQELRTRLDNGTAADWDEAFDQWNRAKDLNQIQALEIDSTVDGWMQAVNKQENDDSDFNDATSGRLFIEGFAQGGNSGISLSARSATFDGLENESLRNRYLNRRIGDIGAMVNFSFPLRGEWGGMQFTGGSSTLSWNGSDMWKDALGYMSVRGQVMTTPNYDWSQDAGTAAQEIYRILASRTLRDLGVSSVDSGGMMN